MIIYLEHITGIMPPSEPSELLSTVSKRIVLLRRLQQGANDKRVLEDSVNLSRSALNVALRQLKEDGLIYEGETGHAVTLSGDTAVKLYEEVWEPYANAHPLFNSLANDTRLDPSLIVKSDVVRAQKHDPDLPLNSISNVVTEGTCISALLPVYRSRYNSFIEPCVSNTDSKIELILEKNSMEGLPERSMELIDFLLTDEHHECRIIPEQVPFGLIIADGEQLCLVIYDSKGSIEGVLLNNSKEAIKWGRDFYSQYYDKSESASV